MCTYNVVTCSHTLNINRNGYDISSHWPFAQTIHRSRVLNSLCLKSIIPKTFYFPFIFNNNHKLILTNLISFSLTQSELVTYNYYYIRCRQNKNGSKCMLQTFSHIVEIPIHYFGFLPLNIKLL